ncbi:hypothetical protein L210DRAFT_948347, partial [Boletus edulis BED1]
MNDVSSECDQLSAVASEIQKIGRRTQLVPADVTIEEKSKRWYKTLEKGSGAGCHGSKWFHSSTFCSL